MNNFCTQNISTDSRIILFYLFMSHNIDIDVADVKSISETTRERVLGPRLTAQRTVGDFSSVGANTSTAVINVTRQHQQ